MANGLKSISTCLALYLLSFVLDGRQAVIISLCVFLSLSLSVSVCEVQGFHEEMNKAKLLNEEGGGV